ncbi:MAG: stalk domain-containing protein [Bacillota bacterium]
MKKISLLTLFLTLFFAVTVTVKPSLAAYTPPSAPSGLTAAAISDSTAGLCWKSSCGKLNKEWGFLIYRKPAGGSYSLVGAVGPGTTIYTDSGLLPGMAYFYTLRAWNERGVSLQSNEAFASTQPPFGHVISFQIGSQEMYVNGTPYKIDPERYTTPVTLNESAYVPVKSIVEATGGTVKWDEGSQSTTIQVKEKTIVLWMGKKTILVDGERKKTDAPPWTIFGRMMAPARLFADCLGGGVHWDDPACRVTIILPP